MEAEGMQKKRVRIKISGRFYVLLMLLVITVFVFQFVKAQIKLKQQNETLAELDRQIEETQEYNDNLNARIADAGSLDSVERTARERLGWVREDEILYVETPQG